MCGRFSLTASRGQIEEHFATALLRDIPPLYNIAPSQPVLVVSAPDATVVEGKNRPMHQSHLVRWGFVPSWVKDPQNWPLTFNIRSETVYEKKSFRNSLHYRRVLFPASGFYEWKKTGKGRSQPYWIRPKNGKLLAFAGLMETWCGKDGSEIDTAAILTRAAYDVLRPIHHRMPVMVQEEDFARWLDIRHFRPQDVADILIKDHALALEVVAIGDKINHTASMGADVQEPMAVMEEATAKNSQDKSQLSLF